MAGMCNSASGPGQGIKQTEAWTWTPRRAGEFVLSTSFSTVTVAHCQ